MNPEEYVKNVLKTESNDFESIRERMSSEFYLRLDHASKGMVTESGEFVDALKKFAFYGRELDLINLIEELGDQLWYIAIACDVLKIPMSEIETMERNIAKLKVRYKNKFYENKFNE